MSPPVALHYVAAPAAARSVVVFLHGLNGDAWETWGPRGSPGTFMARVAREFPAAAVATIDYPSQLERFQNDETLTVEAIAQSWTAAIGNDLVRRYAKLAIVGYCLGGMVAASALRMIWRDDEKELRAGARPSQVLCVFMDTPQRLPTIDAGPPVPQVIAALGLRGSELDANLDCLNGAAAAAGWLTAVALVSSAPGYLAPMGLDAVVTGNRLHDVSPPHMEMSRAPGAGPFEPYDIVARYLREHLR